MVGEMTSTKAQAKVAAGLTWCLVMGWFFATGRPVPLLALVDLRFHELGHFVTYALPWELVTAAMGSVAQIAVPLGLAGYFAVGRRERVSAAVCLAWAATSARGVQAYIADAPFERLQLIGGDHDWAFILTEVGHLDAAAGLARGVWMVGAACFIASIALCASATGRPPPEQRGDSHRRRGAVTL